jgi:hypothetical protein
VNTTWDNKKYGAGIVNIEALLKAPIPDPASLPRAVEPADLESLPLFSSIFPPDTEAQVVDQRFRRLLQVPAGRPTETAAELEGEILHHYSTSNDVQAALDALTVPAPSDAAYAEARRVLLARPVSERLRAALKGRGR